MLEDIEGKQGIILSMKIIKLMAAAAAVLVVGVAFGRWWEHNRMHVSCFILGDWGKSSMATIEKAEQEEFFSGGRTMVLERYNPYGICGGEDREKHWENIFWLAKERGWAEAQYAAALKLAYGDFTTPWIISPDYAELSEETLFVKPSNFGDNREVDVEKSYEFLQLSAAQGFYLAQGDLSHAYLTGEWAGMQVGVDIDKSMRLLEGYMKDDSRRGEGLFFLAQRYVLAGKYNLQSDEKQGMEYFEQSAGYDFAPAMVQLSRRYACGQSVEIDVIAAKEWLAKAEKSFSEQHGDDDISGWMAYMAENRALIDDCIDEAKSG